MDLRGVPFNKVAGFGSDGVSVMTGLGKGVTRRLKKSNPQMLVSFSTLRTVSNVGIG